MYIVGGDLSDTWGGPPKVYSTVESSEPLICSPRGGLEHVQSGLTGVHCRAISNWEGEGVTSLLPPAVHPYSIQCQFTPVMEHSGNMLPCLVVDMITGRVLYRLGRSCCRAVELLSKAIVMSRVRHETG